MPSSKLHSQDWGSGMRKCKAWSTKQQMLGKEVIREAPLDFRIGEQI